MLYPHLMREDVHLTWAIDMKKFLDCRNSCLCKSPGLFCIQATTVGRACIGVAMTWLNSSWGTAMLTITPRGQGMLMAVGFSYLLGLKG